MLIAFPVRNCIILLIVSCCWLVRFFLVGNGWVVRSGGIGRNWHEVAVLGELVHGSVRVAREVSRHNGFLKWRQIFFIFQ